MFFISFILISNLLLSLSKLFFVYGQQISTKAYNSESMLFFEVLFPEEISYSFKIRPAADFGSDLNRTIEEIRLTPVEPHNGCHSFENEIYVKDAVAFIERGSCSFLSKAIQAEKAGAIAAIIYDNTFENDNVLVDMVKDDTDRITSIPSYFLPGKDGKMIVEALSRLRERDAIINIPLNYTLVPMSSLNQPPWTIW